MNDGLVVLNMVLISFLALFILLISSSIFSIICYWKIFKKAGKGGWEILVPIYNVITLTEVSGLSMYFLFLILFPGLGVLIYTILVCSKLSERFGKAAGFTVGLIFLNPIFLGILAFDKNAIYRAEPSNENYVNSSKTFNGTCSRCGAPINTSDKFCMNCGQHL